MRHIIFRGAILGILMLPMFAASIEGAELRASIAASMTELFRDLITTFSKQYPDVKIIPNFGPSGGLAKQIHLGAPADIYVSANPRWMSFLVEDKKIELSTRKIFVHNSLVFVGRPRPNILSLKDLSGLDRIGIGSPKSVPAGQYAKQALEQSGYYEKLLKGGKLVMAKDVRQALIYADRGETGGSFVYKTDSFLAKHAVILFEVPQELYSRVSYPIAITVQGTSKPEAKQFYDYLASDSAAGIITRYGFLLPD